MSTMNGRNCSADDDTQNVFFKLGAAEQFRPFMVLILP